MCDVTGVCVCVCRMSWDWTRRTARRCSTCRRRRSGRSTAASARYVINARADDNDGAWADDGGVGADNEL